MPTLTATATFPLTENTLDLLKKMQMNHPIPEGAKYIAFLEDGDACFLESIESASGPWIPNVPQTRIVTYYENVQVEITE